MSAKPTKRPIVFLAVGIGNTLLDFTTYTLLALFVFSSSLALAGVVSGTVALFVAFTTHALITWKGRQIKRSTILKFFAFTGFGMWVIRPILLAIFANLTWLYDLVFDLSNELSLPFSEDFITSTGAFGFMIIILLIYNYLTYDRFVFSESDTTSRTEQGNR